MMTDNVPDTFDSPRDAMIPSEEDDWATELKPKAMQFLRASAKEIAKLVHNADNMTRFRRRLTEFGDKWNKYRVAEQANQDGTWQPSMGTPENPLGTIWPYQYVEQPSGPGLFFPTYPIGVPHILGDYALLQAVHDHVVDREFPQCSKINDGCLPHELSEEIWRNIVTYADGESGSEGYVNTGKINGAMRDIRADLQDGPGKQEGEHERDEGDRSSSVTADTPNGPTSPIGSPPTSANPFNEQPALARRVLILFDGGKLMEQLRIFAKWSAELEAANKEPSERLQELNHQESQAHDEMKRARAEYLGKKKELDAILETSPDNTPRQIDAMRRHVKRLENEYNSRHDTWNALRGEIKDVQASLEPNPWELLTCTEPTYSADAHITELVRYCFPPETLPRLDAFRWLCLRAVRISILHDRSLPNDGPLLTAGILDKERVNSVWEEMSGDWSTWRQVLEYDINRMQGDEEARGLLKVRCQVSGLATSDAPKPSKIATTECIRLLHLSDLHFDTNTLISTRLQPLISDLCDIKCEHVDCLVVSGDFTNKCSVEGLQKAYEFVMALTKEFGLPTERCIFVPGNHDVHLEANEKHRLEMFSEKLYSTFFKRPYPMEYADQGMVIPCWDAGLQFLMFNSSWQIDQDNRKRASIHSEARANALRTADEQERAARETGHLKGSLLRIGVWHHAVAGPHSMADVDFLNHLQKGGVRIALHGDVHELRLDSMGHWHKEGRQLYIVGSGTFGASKDSRPESTPRLYNLLEIRRDLKGVRVHTRQQPRETDVWKGWNEWPQLNGASGGVPYYDIEL